jgi:hypothetical protein
MLLQCSHALRTLIFLITFFCNGIVSSDAASRVKSEAPHFAPGNEPEKLQLSGTTKLPALDTTGKQRKDQPVGEHAALGRVAPVSTTLWCIINITVQYLLIYTILALIHLYQDYSEQEWPLLDRTFRNAAHTVTYGPAFCVLLLGCRMRINWLTQGRGSAPFTVQMCMLACTIAITVNTLFVLICPIFVREGLSVCDKTGDPYPVFGVDHRGLNIFLQIVRYLFLAVLYGGVAGVIGGMIYYVPPEDMRPDPIPPVSPAVACTMNMSMQFFLVYFFVAFARTVSELRGHRTHFEEVMVDATHTVNMAPMLCILFLSARMRALQIDPVHGHPQEWAQSCFYMCSYALFVQSLLAILVPIILRGEVTNDEYGVGDTKFEIAKSHHCIGKTLTFARYAITICLYGGFIAVIVSIFTHHDQNGNYHPISPTLQCVINLAVQFFLIYFVIWTLLTLKEIAGIEVPRFFQAVETARVTVMFAPILSILFIVMKMRALSLSNNQRSPPVWATIAMILATWAVFLQFCTCLMMAFFGDVVLASDGNVTHRSSLSSQSGQVITNWLIESKVGRVALCLLRVVSMCLFYGGVGAVLTAVLIMTPEMTVGDTQHKEAAGSSPLGVADRLRR